MRRSVVVTGAGVLSPLADSPAGLHAALCAGTSGLKAIELFPLDGLATRRLGPREAGEIRPFEPRELPGRAQPAARSTAPRGCCWRRRQRALDESGWTPELRAEREVGLVLGTTFCSVKTIAEFDRRGLQLGPSHVSPLDFANSVINAAAGQTAIWHGLRGVNSTISAGEASGLLAIAYRRRPDPRRPRRRAARRRRRGALLRVLPRPSARRPARADVRPRCRSTPAGAASPSPRARPC